MARPTARFQSNGDWVLPNQQIFQSGDYLVSRNGRYRLTMSNDSQLMLFEDGNHIWTADDKQPHSLSIKLQTNEKGTPYFYITNSGFLINPGSKRQWIAESSHSKDKSVWSNTHLVLQDDGNIVIQDSRRVWPKTDYPFQLDKLLPFPVPKGEFIQTGQKYEAGDHYLVLQDDGNLVIYNPSNTPTWQSSTGTHGGTKAMMQNDGNLVVFNLAGAPIWHTGTNGQTDAWPYLQPNGELIIMTSTPVWARYGFAPGRSYRKKFYPSSEIKTAKDFILFEWL